MNFNEKRRENFHSWFSFSSLHEENGKFVFPSSRLDFDTCKLGIQFYEKKNVQTWTLMWQVLQLDLKIFCDMKNFKTIQRKFKFKNVSKFLFEFQSVLSWEKVHTSMKLCMLLSHLVVVDRVFFSASSCDCVVELVWNCN